MNSTFLASWHGEDLGFSRNGDHFFLGIFLLMKKKLLPLCSGFLVLGQVV